MAFTAAALLGWEVLLTRLASLRYHFHFGHLAVSNGLLGIGAAASWLGMVRHRWHARPRAWLIRALIAFLGSLLACIALTYALPVHRGTMDGTGTLSFAVFVLASLLPFITGGLVIGLLLCGWPRRSARLYGIDLMAAGSACLLVPALLPILGMAGTLCAVVSMAGAALVSVWGRALSSVGLTTAAMVAWAVMADPAPSKISRAILASTWTPLSRVDVVDVPSEQRTIRSRGIPVQSSTIPPQVEIMQDGSASTLLTDFSGHPQARELLRDALYAAATQIRQNGEVFIVGFGGGDDVWAALSGDPVRIDAVDLHDPVLEAHTAIRPDWSRLLLNDERVNLSVMEGRTALNRLARSYDIVQLTGIDTWAAMSSGAFMLAENYLYTTESFGTMIDRLRPNGVLQITRMAAEMEALRILVQLRVALAERTSVPFRECVLVVGSRDHQVATLVNRDGFSAADIDTIVAWARSAGLTLHHAPGHDAPGLLQQFVRTPNPQDFVDRFPRLIKPTTDQSPYFFQFTRWDSPNAAATAIREPTYISQGNPLWILGLGGYSIAIAVLLLYGPLWVGRRRPATVGVTRYFAGLGLGYIMIELALMNSITLLVGHPMRAFSITVAGMLVTSGIASLNAHRFGNLRWLPVALAAAIGITLALLPAVTEHAHSWPIAARCIAAVAFLSPIGLLLGLPFAHRVSQLDPDSIPWAWATNAVCSVVGAVAVIAISMTASFAAVCWTAVAIYGIALYGAEPTGQTLD